MGYAEEAKINLAKGKDGDASALQVAQVQAVLALLETVDGLAWQVDHLTAIIETARATDSQPSKPPANAGKGRVIPLD